MIEKTIRKGKKKKKETHFDMNFVASEYYYGIILAAEVLNAAKEAFQT